MEFFTLLSKSAALEMRDLGTVTAFTRSFLACHVFFHFLEMKAKGL